MSAKPPTIYLGTRSHIRTSRVKSTKIGGPSGYRRNWLKQRSWAQSNSKKLKRSNLATKNLSSTAGSTTSTNSKSSLSKATNMTTSVLHLPTATPDLSNSGGALGQQNTSSNPTSPTPKTTTAKPGLPSPTLSETSDYQRSTPSPNAGNEDQADIDWSSHDHQEKPTRRKSTSSLSSSSSSSKISNNLVLQQLRVALKKLPEAKLKPMEALKRRHSDCGLIEAAISKKVAKVDATLTMTPTKQGKITEYLPEMKHFIALRKEKLDRVLNLSSAASTTPNSPCKSDLDSGLKSSLESNESDISNSPSKQKLATLALQGNSNVESGVETGSNDTASVASSGSRSSGIGSRYGRDEDVFEVPRTIRFPAAAPTKCYSEVVICKWELCGMEFDSTGKLLDHLKTIHAVAENQKEETDSSEDNSNSIQYKCLWEGCKVYGKGSSSKLWLEKHVMSHGGNKPFQCIVDGCKHRFGTQSLLERHVNNHFKNKELNSSSVSSQSHSAESGNSSNLPVASRSCASNQSSNASSSKAFRKLIGRKVKYRKEKFSARIFDLFDVGVMAQLRMKLSEHEKKCQEWKDGGHLDNPYINQAHQVVILHSKIIARKTDSNGNQRVLQSWTPPNILEDEWILAKDVVPTKSVKLSSLPISAKVQVSTQLYNYPSTLTTTRPKRGRKVRPHPRSTALS